MKTPADHFYYFSRLGFHLSLFAGSLIVAFLLRFDYGLPSDQISLLAWGLGIALPAKALVFRGFGLHRGGWRYTSMADLTWLLRGVVVSSGVFVGLGLLVIGPMFPRSVYGIDFLLTFLLTAAGRCSVRLLRESRPISRHNLKNLLIYGAGSEGTALAREIRGNPALGYRVVGFLDDSSWKREISILGIPVLGTVLEVGNIVQEFRERGQAIDEIAIAIDGAGRPQIREGLDLCRATGVTCKMIPAIGDLLTGKVQVSDLRPVAMHDLLGRPPVKIEQEEIKEHIAGRSVLVTGAAGSIGSELCRQIASFQPARLVALDQAESDLFRIDNELREKFPECDIVAEIGDIRDDVRVREVIRHHAIEAIFHAAAYKHVPLMEAHPLEAIRNNVLGTWNLVRAAYDFGVETFLMISSDKAVRPTSVMGATKRASELLLLSMPEDRTRFISVRFGNVLGSNGSVIPLFQAQIAAGGPVTVTHPEMRRYFMTIPEAVQLVLLASTMGKGSEVYVLDMGEPVRIVDLARQMVRLAGRVPDKDIEIRFTGMRPGEKLYEELITEGEDILPTEHQKIRIFKGPKLEQAVMERWLDELVSLLADRDEIGTIAHLKGLIREYKGAEKYPVAREAAVLTKIQSA